jgi:hypothetical protein
MTEAQPLRTGARLAADDDQGGAGPSAQESPLCAPTACSRPARRGTRARDGKELTSCAGAAVPPAARTIAVANDQRSEIR